MSILDPGRFALSICATSALLSGCGGNTASVVAIPPNVSGGTLPHHHTFNYTGAEQSFLVPNGVSKITVVARGAAGAGYSSKARCGYHECFGRGGRVYAIIPVRAGERLYVFVGGQGSTTGGFNGGGNPGTGPSQTGGYGGGGASDVREGGEKLHDRVLVAGGGGGQGSSNYYYDNAFGGKGGGSIGGAGDGLCFSSAYSGCGGAGGTQSQGGAGGAGGKGAGPEAGAPGNPGALRRGGNGGNGGYNPSPSGPNEGGGGGGGGGGYYGGGGGGGGGAAFGSLYGSPGGGGGGGSSYIEPKASKFQSWQGWYRANANGLVVFSWK
jgi:hypothetical protein